MSRVSPAAGAKGPLAVKCELRNTRLPRRVDKQHHVMTCFSVVKLVVLPVAC